MTDDVIDLRNIQKKKKAKKEPPEKPWDERTKREKFEELWLWTLLPNRIFAQNELWLLSDELGWDPVSNVYPTIQAENYDFLTGEFLIDPDHVSRKELLAAVKRTLKEKHPELLTFSEAYSIYKKLKKFSRIALADFDSSIKIEKLKPFVVNNLFDESLSSIMVKLYRIPKAEAKKLIRQRS